MSGPTRDSGKVKLIEVERRGRIALPPRRRLKTVGWLVVRHDVGTVFDGAN